MRKVISYVRNLVRFALPMLAVSACIGFDAIPDTPISETYPVRLSADSSSPVTRVSVDGTRIAWEQDDKIQVTAVSADGRQATSELTWFSGVDGKDSHFATFSGFVTMESAPQECHFVYPVRSSTIVDSETGNITLYYNSQTGLHEPVMCASVAYDKDGMSAKLDHVGAMLEIDVRMPQVSQVTLVGNRLETLSPVVYDPHTGDVSLTSQSNVQITVPVNPDGYTYIAVPPVNMEKGFSLVCSNDDATMSMIRSFSSDGGVGCDFSAKRGHIMHLVLEGELENYSITSSAPTVEHTKSSAGLLTGTSVRFTMYKSGTSDKVIEEWGATLLNDADEVVRRISYTGSTPISGEEVTMDVTDSWKLLPAGTYVFTPYYRIYGQIVSLDSRSITVPDPGVRLTLHGQTSYDKFLAGDVSGANSHQNTTIKGVAVSTNVDQNIIDVYSATIDGVDLGTATVTSGSELKASYGDLTRNKFKKYVFKSSIQVGKLTFAAEKDFHITGLPYEGNFTGSNPTGWDPSFSLLGAAEYSDRRITFKYGILSEDAGAIVTPQYYLPDGSLKVTTAADVCSKRNDKLVYVGPCAYGKGTISDGSVTIAVTKVSSLSSKDYKDASASMTLTTSTPCLMYSATPTRLYNIAMYRLKINYAK